jgi:hypothetical protein
VVPAGSPVEKRGLPMPEDTGSELTAQEIDAEVGEELPDRDAMSLVNLNLAAPINAAVAANVLSDGAIAYADAEQTTPIDQGI